MWGEERLVAVEGLGAEGHIHSLAFSQVPIWTPRGDTVNECVNATEPPYCALPVLSVGGFHRTPATGIPDVIKATQPPLCLAPVPSAWKSGACGQGLLPVGHGLWWGVPVKQPCSSSSGDLSE